LAVLGAVLAHVLFVACSERTDFFPDDDRAGTGGESHAGAGQQTIGGTSTLGGNAGSAGARAGSGGSVSGSANGGEQAMGGTGTAGSSGAAGQSANGGSSGDGAAAGTAGRGSSGEPGSSGEAGATGNESGGASGEPGGGNGGSGASSGSGANGGGGGTGGALAGSSGGGEAGAGCTAKTERCNGVDDDCNDSVDEGVCPDGCAAKAHDGHVYLFCLETDADEQPIYSAAREHCEDLGEKLALEKDFALARVESSSENDFLKTWIGARTSAEGAVWFGANDLEDEDMWVFGDDPPSARFFTAVGDAGGVPYMDRFNDFASGRPNSTNGADEDCGAFDSEVAWQWNDVRCGVGRLGYFCEEAP
jgi:hypothetical protein